MTTIVFYISCSLLLLLALCMLFYMIFASRKMKNKRFQLRRKSFIAFFALLAVTVTANTHIVHDGQPEILCTNAMCWEYITFVTFILLSIAHFGKDYYKNPYSWFMLLQYAVICVVGNVVSLTLDLYKPLYHYSDICHTESFIGAFFVVREIMTIIIITCYIFMIYMLINSYLKCFRKKKEVSTEVRKRMNDEAVSIFSYTSIMTFSMSAHFIESIWPHFVANMLLLVAVSRTYFIYDRYRKACLQKSSEKSPAQIIADELRDTAAQRGEQPYLPPESQHQRHSQRAESVQREFQQLPLQELRHVVLGMGVGEEAAQVRTAAQNDRHDHNRSGARVGIQGHTVHEQGVQTEVRRVAERLPQVAGKEAEADGKKQRQGIKNKAAKILFTAFIVFVSFCGLSILDALDCPIS